MTNFHEDCHKSKIKTLKNSVFERLCNLLRKNVPNMKRAKKINTSFKIYLLTKVNFQLN